MNAPEQAAAEITVGLKVYRRGDRVPTPVGWVHHLYEATDDLGHPVTMACVESTASTYDGEEIRYRMYPVDRLAPYAPFSTVHCVLCFSRQRPLYQIADPFPWAHPKTLLICTRCVREIGAECNAPARPLVAAPEPKEGSPDDH